MGIFYIVFIAGRAAAYVAKTISDQIPKGYPEGWRFDIPPVYLIAILEDFKIISKNENYISRYSLRDEETNELFLHDQRFIFIELCKFVKQENDLITRLDKWIYALTHPGRLTSRPQSFDRQVILPSQVHLANQGKSQRTHPKYQFFATSVNVSGSWCP